MKRLIAAMVMAGLLGVSAAPTLASGRDRGHDDRGRGSRVSVDVRGSRHVQRPAPHSGRVLIAPRPVYVHPRPVVVYPRPIVVRPVVQQTVIYHTPPLTVYQSAPVYQPVTVYQPYPVYQAYPVYQPATVYQPYPVYTVKPAQRGLLSGLSAFGFKIRF